jgi:PilZ domain
MGRCGTIDVSRCGTIDVTSAAGKSIAATIILEDSSAMIECIIRDLTPGGACLEFTPLAQLPRRFGLLIDPTSEKRRCDVVWQHENRVGVEFV